MVEEKFQQKIEEGWAKVVEKHAHAFDGLLWRLGYIHDSQEGEEWREGQIGKGYQNASWIDERKGGVSLTLSPIRYSQHNILRHEVLEDASIVDKLLFYPNPLTVYTVMETLDGYLPLGVRGKTSDQKGLTMFGAGFLQRYSKDKVPEKLEYCMIKECMEEVEYKENAGFNANNARVMALVFGSNHDTTTAFYLPLQATHKELGLGNDEHNDMLFLPNDAASIQKVLDTGAYKGFLAADHLLGSLEAYLINRNKGNI